MREIAAAHLKDAPSPNNKKFDKGADLETKIGSAKDSAKKVYQAFKDLPENDDKKKNGVYDALVELIGKLEETSDWNDKPKSLESDFASGDKKTAWEFINEQTKGDDAYKAKGG